MISVFRGLEILELSAITYYQLHSSPLNPYKHYCSTVYIVFYT